MHSDKGEGGAEGSNLPTKAIPVAFLSAHYRLKMDVLPQTDFEPTQLF